jgi:isopropylmalate/homocitrate/citramalate synthase
MTRKTEMVLLQEVGPRDGLQNEPTSLTPELRAKFINGLAESGLSRIQIGSFVNPRRVPQMLGTNLVWSLVQKRPGIRFSVLVLNEKGLEKAITEHIPHIEIYVSVSETHSIKNTGMEIRESLAQATRIISEARAHEVTVTAGVMCALGCAYEGAIKPARVMGLVRDLEACGPDEIVLADTTGMGKPDQVASLVESVGEITGMDRIGLHLHDTHGRGYENLRAALRSGARRFDASIGGIGGCPFIPGAEGNIATETTVQLIESLGYSTGVNVQCLVQVGNELKEMLGQEND